MAAAVALTGLTISGIGTIEAGAAAKPVRFSLSISGHGVGYRGATAILSIRMRTGGSAETAGVGLSQSGWPDRRVIGSPIAFDRQRISGAGSITGGFASSPGGYAGGIPLCVRGTFIDPGGGVTVSLPAGSITTLTYRVRLAAPPWPGMKPTIGAYAYVPAVGQDGPQNLGTDHVATVGSTGVHISLSARDAAIQRRNSDPVVPHGGTVVIAGTTDPNIAEARLRIGAESYVGKTQRIKRTPIGTAATDGRGHFHITWRPRGPAAYTVIAAYDPARGLLPDQSCDLALEVR